MKKLIKKICEQEGKKHQASVADVREIIKILVNSLIEDPVCLEEFLIYTDKVFIKIINKKG